MIAGPVQFHLVRESKIGNLKEDFGKILDYLATLEDIGLTKDSEGLVTISYTQTPLKATLRTDLKSQAQDTVVSQQITLTCDRRDNVSINLLKNVIPSIGYRIFNPLTHSFLVNDPNLQDLTTIKLEPKVSKIFKKYDLKPLFHYRNSLVFFAKDKGGKIHLVNRHLLEYLSEDKSENKKQKSFSVIVAPDIGRFIALFDRGLMPISFYENYFGDIKVSNMSGFDIDKFGQIVFINPILFELDLTTQSFNQARVSDRVDLIKRGSSLSSYIKKLSKSLKIKNKILALKLTKDLAFIKTNKGDLVPRITLSIFLDQAKS